MGPAPSQIRASVTASGGIAQGEGVVGVRALATTPVKGLGLQSREAIRLGPLGAADNRRFFLIDQRDRMVNGKQIGALAAVGASYDEERGALTMTFPGGDVVEGVVSLAGEITTRFFSREVQARLISGPWSAALSEHAGRDLRLVMAPEDATAVDRGRAGAVSLISRASVQRLERIASREVDVRRFRMLVEIDGVEAHAEDSWVGQRVRIGAALVLVRGHVGRCLVTGQDPDTGVADMPTLDLLRSYRQHLDTSEPLAFGIYGEVIEPGVVRCGDPVGIETRSPEAV